jgi:hypothetical protein
VVGGNCGDGMGHGNAVTGGYVYHGSAIPDLEGLYVFADACTGKIYVFETDGAAGTELLLLDTDALIASLAEDKNGELLIADLYGNIFRLVPAPPP